MEFLQPVKDVVDEEVAHRAIIFAVKVDRRAPRRVMVRVEEVRGVGVQIVALWAEVIVDHVQQHHQPAFVSGVDQTLEVFRPAIGGIGREGQHAVVAPVAATGKIGHRHDLQRGYAQIGEIVEPLDNAVEVARRREAADVQLVDHRLFPGPAAPVAIGPVEGGRVDDLGGAMDVVWVVARGRIGHQQSVR